MATPRRPDLDWLRVVCIAILLAYHVGMFFVTWSWHLKNPELLAALEPLMGVLHEVRMPLLMLIAGTGAAFALRTRGLGAFAWDRTRRLLFPVVFATLVIVPPQIYVERLANGTTGASYLEFWPSVFAFEPYPSGNTSWHHLWFVLYLFVYCVAALPLFALLARPRAAALLARAGHLLSRGWALFFLFVPWAVIRVALHRYPETHALVDDPRALAGYGYLFLIGHLLGRLPSSWDAITAQRRRHAIVFAVLLAILLPDGELPRPFEDIAICALAWAALLAALGYARARVTGPMRWLSRAQELAYPFYIWHQTVILVLASVLLRLDPPIGAWPRLALLLTASAAVTYALTWLVAQSAWLRPCFGMGPRGARAVERAPAILKPA